MTGDPVQAQQRLYALLQQLQQEIPTAAAAALTLGAGGGNQRADDALAELTRQQQQVALALANVSCSTGDYPLAIIHLEQLVHAAGAEMVCYLVITPTHHTPGAASACCGGRDGPPAYAYAYA